MPNFITTQTPSTQQDLQLSPTSTKVISTNSIDMKVVNLLADQLQVLIPKNNDLRSKAFLCHAKEQMLRCLYETINQSNKVELNFKRQNFSHYKGFVGRGNNAQLIHQLFKASRWWWNLFSEPTLDEAGKPIFQQGQTSNLMKEDFKEHNFIFTQWKKQNHFVVMKSIKVSNHDEQTDPA